MRRKYGFRTASLLLILVRYGSATVCIVTVWEEQTGRLQVSGRPARNVPAGRRGRLLHPALERCASVAPVAHTSLNLCQVCGRSGPSPLQVHRSFPVVPPHRAMAGS